MMRQEGKSDQEARERGGRGEGVEKGNAVDKTSSMNGQDAQKFG